MHWQQSVLSLSICFTQDKDKPTFRFEELEEVWFTENSTI